MDLTEEDIQIWYFGPDDVGTTEFKLSTWTYFSFAAHRRTPITTIGDIKYFGESHCISCIRTNYTSSNYLYHLWVHHPKQDVSGCG